MFPKGGFNPLIIDRYNAEMEADYVNIRDFLIAHYKVTEREDTPFWRYCKAMSIPDSLATRLEIFRARGEAMVVHHELFKEQSWFAVLMGQGLTPVDHHPVADLLSEGRAEAAVGQGSHQHPGPGERPPRTSAVHRQALPLSGGVRLGGADSLTAPQWRAGLRPQLRRLMDLVLDVHQLAFQRPPVRQQQLDPVGLVALHVHRLRTSPSAPAELDRARRCRRSCCAGPLLA
jgi:hypothetical protein